MKRCSSGSKKASGKVRSSTNADGALPSAGKITRLSPSSTVTVSAGNPVGPCTDASLAVTKAGK